MAFLPDKLHHGYDHGHATGGKYSPTYRTWLAMRDRCRPHNAVDKPYYAGKGITVCPQWEDFNVFLSDMGERPHGKTIDRIDSNGNYEPNNCRWAGQTEQSENRSTTKIILFNGESVTLSYLSREYKIPTTTIYTRYKNGIRGEALVCNKNRNYLRVGSKSASAKLSESDVVKIKQMLEDGTPSHAIAKTFGVSGPAISDIKRGVTWGHVTL